MAAATVLGHDQDLVEKRGLWRIARLEPQPTDRRTARVSRCPELVAVCKRGRDFGLDFGARAIQRNVQIRCVAPLDEPLGVVEPLRGNVRLVFGTRERGPA